jgi:predicted dehydrogenase
MEYKNGATGVFITSTGDVPGTNRLEILGDKGKLVCDKNDLTYYRLETPEREFNRTYKGGFGEPKSELIKVETDGKNDQHVGIMNNFTKAILGKEELFVNGVEGLHGVELMDAMLLSTWIDVVVELPIDDERYLSELNKRIEGGRKKESVDVVLDTEGTYGSK